MSLYDALNVIPIDNASTILNCLIDYLPIGTDAYSDVYYLVDDVFKSAIACKNQPMIKFFVNAYRKTKFCGDYLIHEAFKFAIKNSDIETVKLIIDSGIDIDSLIEINFSMNNLNTDIDNLLLIAKATTEQQAKIN